MSESIRKQYNIPEEAKVLLYVGNISQNKNQEQMVRAFALLPEDLQRKSYVLFCGQDNDNAVKLHDLIKAQKYADHLKLCGGIDKKEMPKYYQAADGVVLLSFAEGFGLSLIEGLYFGIPCAMPFDLDAFSDIFDESASVCINNRSDDTVASNIEKLLSSEWNKNAIKDYSRKFAPAAMAKNYIDVYKKLLF